MRFKITLQVNSRAFGRSLPLNYMYELSSAVYRILSKSDIDYSSWLHKNGFEADRKRFKLFTFSRFVIPRYKIDKENQRLSILSDEVDWYITFLPEKSTRQFIEGVFKFQKMQVGDKRSTVEFMVRSIEILPPLQYKEEMFFETLSPVCISRRGIEVRTEYLSPAHSDYENAIITGVLARYKAYNGEVYNGPLFCDFKLLNTPRSVLVKMKSDTPEQTFVRGYNYRFKIHLPEPLMHIVYNCGLGEKGSLGFGMLKEIPPKLK